MCIRDSHWAVYCPAYGVAVLFKFSPPHNFYADLAAAFLHDEDAKEGKLVRYWECIPDR